MQSLIKFYVIIVLHFLSGRACYASYSVASVTDADTEDSDDIGATKSHH